MNMLKPSQHESQSKLTPVKASQQSFSRIGILGGTFDPIHLGHIIPAIENANWLSLDKLYLLPAHIPPHKTQTSANATHRKAMVELVCQQYPIFQLDDRELYKDTPSYTLESLKDIHQQYPNSQVFFIIGMDSLLTFTHWHRWSEILQYCHLLVNTRPDYDVNALKQACHQSLSPYFTDDLTLLSNTQSGKILFHQNTNIDISSTQVRQAIKANNLDENTLCPSVLNYIKQHQLYR
ncbi:nicotinate-nucleotide adenylyltransferase [Thalassotalea sp. SU-HH00458]